MSVLDFILSVRLLFAVGLVPKDLILYFQIFLQKHLQCPFIGHLALEGTKYYMFNFLIFVEIVQPYVSTVS